MNGYPGDAWSRLRDWLKQEHDTILSQITSGACEPDEYKALCREAGRIMVTVNQMKLIQSGQDLLAQRAPSPLRNVE